MSLLRDIYLADAEQDDIETLARHFAAAMEAHIQGREEADAARAAAEA